jgi:hypothetical protein
MGYKHSYDIVQAYQQIRSAATECSDLRTDGFIAWGVKQDLYQFKWYLDELLKQCPEFSSVETDWLREQEQKKIIRILKDDQA